MLLGWGHSQTGTQQLLALAEGVVPHGFCFIQERLSVSASLHLDQGPTQQTGSFQEEFWGPEAPGTVGVEQERTPQLLMTVWC